MKFIVLFLVSISIPSLAFGQQIAKLKMDSLQITLLDLENESKLIDQKIIDTKEEIKRLSDLSKYEEGKLKVKCLGGFIISQPSTLGEVIAQVPKDAFVYVYADFLKDDFLKVKFGEYDGFIYKEVLEQTKDLTTLLNNALRFSDNERRKELIKKYGESNGSLIYNKAYWIGMEKVMLLESLGSPLNTTQTNYRNEIREMLTYEKYSKKIFFHFEKGKLISYQD